METLKLKSLPKDAVPLGGGYYQVGRRRYIEADVINYETGEVVGKEYRDSRFEYPDPTPVHVPIYLKRAESTDQRIKRLMNEQRAWEEWCKRVDEGIEDIDDFDIPERPMFTSKYEDYLDLRREAQRISAEDLAEEVQRRNRKKRRRQEDQMDIEDFTEDPEESPKKSPNPVDKNSKMGHNKGPKMDEE